MLSHLSRRANPVSPTAAKRLLSIDALRGFTVAFMILVNNAGDGNSSYAQLRHSIWNGCTLTDLVFPMFLFIMGVSAAIALGSRLHKGITRSAIARQVVRRSIVIVLIGLALNALPVPHLATLRYCGVMQRIGACYLIAGLALLYLRPMGVAFLAGAAVAGYWMLLRKVLVPGFGIPGIDMPLLDPRGNLASYIDRLIIPEAHRYHFSFYDPEGILSTLPAVATTCFGMLAGAWIKRPHAGPRRKLTAIAATALLLLLAGVMWSYFLPFNKRLWTSSYVLFAAGVSLALLAIFQWTLDYKQLLRSQLEPFLAFGVNALTAYVFSELLAIVLGSVRLGSGRTAQQFLYEMLPAALGSAPFRSLIWSILFVAVCWLPVFYLRRREIIAKL